MHQLKKYPNRRLYDTTDSRYVTVDDVRKLIVRGESISVEDSRDGSDITRDDNPFECGLEGLRRNLCLKTLWEHGLRRMNGPPSARLGIA